MPNDKNKLLCFFNARLLCCVGFGVRWLLLVPLLLLLLLMLLWPPAREPRRHGRRCRRHGSRCRLKQNNRACVRVGACGCVRMRVRRCRPRRVRTRAHVVALAAGATHAHTHAICHLTARADRREIKGVSGSAIRKFAQHSWGGRHLRAPIQTYIRAYE